jgi:membrane fusion protein (multidrug efflux system)
VKRYTPLAKEQAISKEELDNAEQANLAAEAQVKADEAAVKIARVNLDFTKVVSPIDGLAGIALAQIGDLVSPSTGLLTTVSTIHPIKAYFQISEQLYLSMGWRDALAKNATSSIELQLILSDGSIYPEMGRVHFADRQMNPSTGTLQIVGLFPNPKFTLRPGQYGRIRAQTEVKRNALALPQRAVTELQGTYQVALVGEENRVHVESVKVGEQIGSIWIIEDGLRPGDRVVVEGLQKAKNGKVVNPTPFKVTARDPKPPTLGVANPTPGHRRAN